MAKIERLRNTNDTSNSGSVVVGSASAVTLVAANPKRLSLVVTNNSNQLLWVREFPAATTPTLKEPIRIEPNSSREIMMPDNPYTGEVSAIMNNGGNKTVPFSEK